jgi:hypothetical protein
VRAARVLAALALAAAALSTAGVGATAPPEDSDDLAAAQAAHVDAARRYRQSLKALRPLQAAEVTRAASDLERRRALHADGLIAAVDVEAAIQRLEQARDAAARTGAAVREADALLAEAEAARVLARLPAPRPDEVQEAPTLIRHPGRAPWSLAAVPALERFFSERFGEPLPVSAYGQTPAHDRLGFDHRHALDVALHPDSPQGRALMAHLHAQGIPFLAFRAAAPGAATGAHIHVGPPSGRL